MEYQVEATIVRMPRHPPEPLGVAMVAASRDSGAAGDRVPRRVGPLNGSVIAQDILPCFATPSMQPPTIVGNQQKWDSF